MMCSMLSREKAHPALLITSAGGTPEWVSSLETLKLAVGLCDFTCCQRNHTFPGIGVVPCDRDITREILEKLIKAKLRHLLDTSQYIDARFTFCFTHWWLRTSSALSRLRTNDMSIETFKRDLHWETTSWFDGQNISILFYAVVANASVVVRTLLEDILSCSDKEMRKRRLSSRVSRNGVVKFGIPGGMTSLMMAMCTSSPDIVSQMLKAGADPFETDKGGYDALMAATM